MNNILSQTTHAQPKGIYFTNSLAASFNRSIEQAPSKASHSFKMQGWTIAKAERAPLSVDERKSIMGEAIRLIFTTIIRSNEWLHNALNNFVDGLMDKELSYSSASNLEWVIKEKRIPNHEMANALVDRLIGLLKEIGTIEKGLADEKDKYTVQLRILEVLSKLIRLTKIEDPKKIHDLVMLMIETSKNTSKFGPDAVLETLKNLHWTGINCFNNETLTAEIAFLQEIRKVGPYAMNINSPWDNLVTGHTSDKAAMVLSSICANEVYGGILTLKEVMGWTDEVEAPKDQTDDGLFGYTFEDF